MAWVIGAVIVMMLLTRGLFRWVVLIGSVILAARGMAWLVILTAVIMGLARARLEYQLWSLIASSSGIRERIQTTMEVSRYRAMRQRGR